ncbi:hypothetical protein AOE01nite_12240 [Acetobacter oeni]|uniref:Uncharacterized protein n=1 Tax=Acetobacter oeni TaxID=304077 RepID=A0A511XJ73_9PROT|nr:hypothetical protein AOE01nite_12240 [Acetobacter oeni]
MTIQHGIRKQRAGCQCSADMTGATRKQILCPGCNSDYVKPARRDIMKQADEIPEYAKDISEPDRLLFPELLCLADLKGDGFPGAAQEVEFNVDG